MPAISETATSYNMLNSQLLISQKGRVFCFSLLVILVIMEGRLWNPFP